MDTSTTVKLLSTCSSCSSSRQQAREAFVWPCSAPRRGRERCSYTASNMQLRQDGVGVGEATVHDSCKCCIAWPSANQECAPSHAASLFRPSHVRVWCSASSWLGRGPLWTSQREQEHGTFGTAARKWSVAWWSWRVETERFQAVARATSGRYRAWC